MSCDSKNESLYRGHVVSPYFPILQLTKYSHFLNRDLSQTTTREKSVDMRHETYWACPAYEIWSHCSTIEKPTFQEVQSLNAIDLLPQRFKNYIPHNWNNVDLWSIRMY